MFCSGIGFNMWHVEVTTKNKGKKIKIKCFPDGAKANSTERLYEVYGDYEFPLELKYNQLKLEMNDEARLYKCVARDAMDRIVSTQIYIVTTYSKSVVYSFIIRACMGPVV